MTTEPIAPRYVGFLRWCKVNCTEVCRFFFEGVQSQCLDRGHIALGQFHKFTQSDILIGQEIANQILEIEFRLFFALCDISGIDWSIK